MEESLQNYTGTSVIRQINLVAFIAFQRVAIVGEQKMFCVELPRKKRDSSAALEQLVLESHVILRLQANTCTEYVGQSAALLGQGVDNWGTRRSQGSFEHVAQHAEDAVEALVFSGVISLPANTGHHLGKHNQVNDERRCKQRILTDVEQADGLMTAHENFRVILIQSTLVVTNARHVLDHNTVVGVLILLIQDVVGSNHVIDNIGLGDLLGAELLLRAQVLTIIVTKVVVAGNGGKFDTGVDQKVNKSRLHLGLARLEIVTTNEGIVLLSEVDGTGNKGVLRGSIDERSLVQDTGNREDSRRRDFRVTCLDGVQKVVSGVVDARDDVGVTLGIGSPHDDHFVETIFSLEVAVLVSTDLSLNGA